MSARNPATALAEALVDELVRGGLRHALLSPGSRSTPLALALHAHPEITLHVTLDERSAAFCALGIGRATGRPAAVVSTSGTAAVNFHPGVVEADAAGVPLLVLTADRPPELRETGANQTIDQVRLYGGAVRWSCEVGVAERRRGAARYWRSLAARALAVSMGVPAGPVHLNLAFREPLVPAPGDWPEELGGRDSGRAWTERAEQPRSAALTDLRWLAERIRATQRGVVVLGDRVRDAAPLLRLAEALGWPVLAEPQSGGRCGEHAISTYDLLLRDETFAASHHPDLALVVGRVGLSKALLAWLGSVPQHVLLDPAGAWLDPGRTVSRVVVGDPALVADDLLAADPRQRPGAAREESSAQAEWIASWREAERRARAALDAALDAQDEPSEPRTARDVAAWLPEGGALVVASSMPVRDLNTFMAPRGRVAVHGNRGASGIDGFISTSLGVALGHDGPVCALAGDLSVLHDVNGLLLDTPADLVLVVVNNDGGGIFSFLPQAGVEGFERLFGTPHGVHFARLASAYGVGHRSVGSAGGLPAALDAARAEGGIQLVEVRTNRAANVALHRRLEEHVRAAR